MKLLILLAAFIGLSNEAGAAGSEEFVRRAVGRYEMLERFNMENDSKGRSHLNDYVVELNADWIEENPGKKIIKNNYDKLRDMLKAFNSREDALRLYVVVVNNYKAKVDYTVTLSNDLSVDSKKLRYLAELSESTFKENFYKDASKITDNVFNALKKKNIENRVIYFFGQITYFTPKKEEQLHYYDNISITGAIQSQESKIKEIAKAGLSLSDVYSVSTVNGAGILLEKAIGCIISSLQLVVDKSLNLKPDFTREASGSFKSGIWLKDDNISVQYENGKLYTLSENTKTEYKEELAGFLKKTVPLLKKITTTTDGDKLLKDLQSSGFNFTITDIKNRPQSTNASSKFIAHDPDAANVLSFYDQHIFNTQKLGSGGIVYWNSEAKTAGVPDVPEAVLAHELFHAQDASRGWIDNRPVNNKEAYSGWQKKEYRAVYFENKIRKQLGGEQWDFDPEHNPIDVPPPSISWLDN